jgi:hypothetical protein
VHCKKCCLQLAKNKNGTVPKHYADFPAFGLTQPVCDGSGSDKYWEEREVRRCDRPRSAMICKACNKKVTAKRDGRISKHNDGYGTECSASWKNR